MRRVTASRAHNAQSLVARGENRRRDKRISRSVAARATDRFAKIENMTGKTLANAFIDHFAKFVSWRSDSSGATVSARARIYNREESVIPT